MASPNFDQRGENLNLAALWQLPVLFCCENNLYAMGTALARSESQTDIALKAEAYEIPAWPVDGMDVLAVEEATRRAVAAVRVGAGPHFLEEDHPALLPEHHPGIAGGTGLDVAVQLRPPDR